MRLRLVEAAQRVAEERDEFLLRAAAEAFGHVSHDRFRRVVDLHRQPLVAGKGGLSVNWKISADHRLARCQNSNSVNDRAADMVVDSAFENWSGVRNL